jgi:hypothetical protein
MATSIKIAVLLMLRHSLWWKVTDISEVLTVFIIRVGKYLPDNTSHNIPESTNLHDYKSFALTY